MRIVRHPSDSEVATLLARPAEEPAILQRVESVLERVKNGGDTAILELIANFESCGRLESFRVTADEIEDATYLVDVRIKDALAVAMRNVRTFHEAQLPKSSIEVEVVPGLRCWKKFTPLERVGIYVPAGSAPLFSSLYMAAIAAQVAGVREIVACAPPQKSGTIHPVILYVAKLLGITEFYKIGGATAIAGLAYGSESIKPVDKIAGPGSPYTSIAKQLLSSRVVDIDIVAGPSEVLVIADDSANPEFVAADLLAQAEHGATSQVILISTSEDFLNRSIECVSKQQAELPRSTEVSGAIANSAAVLVDSIERAVAISNAYGPEHLIIDCKNYAEAAELVHHAGSVFIGPFAAEVMGDYGSGTNHILPTGGWARRQGGVGPLTFMKGVTFQEISDAALQQIGPSLAILARTEELEAHARAIDVRLKTLR